MSAGEALDKCLEEALRVGALLEESLEFSYDQQLGYLTQCPTNLGAGLRASVMLHLPLLTRTGQIDGVISAASKVGLEIRGLYGEGSRAQGELYQVSNSVTLGFYEQELCEKLKDAAGGIVRQEQALRQAFRQQYPGRLEDRVWRAAGLLRYARRISGQEAEELLSDLRLGVDCGVLAGVAPHKLNQLIYQIKPACLETAAGRPLEPEERDGARADLLRQALREIQEGE
jgi:protein arginine kinase